MIWEKLFRENKDIHQAIAIELATRRIMNGETHYPKDEDIYKIFDHNQPKDIKVIVVGQDPYHGENEAMGLAFSVPKSVKIPPSLLNIYKELRNDLGIPISTHGDLTKWSKQGVMLLNSCLTVTKDKPGSHFDVGWEMLTDEAISILSKLGEKVFLLWGKKAQEKESLIDKRNNLVLKAAHPSPFSAAGGFFGSKPFSKTNEYLISKNKTPIDWNLND